MSWRALLRRPEARRRATVETSLDSVIVDTREHTQADESLQRSERGFRALFDDNPQPMFVFDPSTGRFLGVNEAALVLYGYTRDRFLSLLSTDLRVPEQHAQLADDLGVMQREANTFWPSVRHRTRGGDVLELEVTGRAVEFDGQPARIVLIHDVTERIGLHRELEHQAFHDALTGLPNRALFYDRVAHVHRRLRGGSSRYAVLMVDLDNFRTVNDSFGHGAGEEILLELSRRLVAALRPGDTAARLGGDEFGILLEGLDGDGEALAAAESLLAGLRHPYTVAGRPIAVGATIGIALSGDLTEVATDVMRNADVALYAGKACGKDRLQLFSEAMHTAVFERMTLEQELREGLLREEFVVHYQPQVDSRSGLVVGVEALVRWNHPVRGLLAPAAFIAVAEDSGLIVDLDAWVLETACRQGVAWMRSPADPLVISVNVSGRELEGPGLIERVRRVLDDTGLDPRRLELELTESAVMRQQEAALSMLREIRALGVRIAIDDFGTGYSMLSRLQDFPLDTLKIDQSFIGRITTLDADSPIVSATVAMARGLDLQVVAEGVETERQRTYLVRQGCGQLQGYLISRPVEAAAIPPMLNVPPLAPVEDLRWAALECALGVTLGEPAVEDLVCGLLVELQRLTGLDSVYLTRIHWDRGEQEIVSSRNCGPTSALEGLILPWPNTLSHSALSGTPAYAALHVQLPQSGVTPALGHQMFISVPVLLRDGSMFGTLCGASELGTQLAPPGLEVMPIFASLIAAQIVAPSGVLAKL